MKVFHKRFRESPGKKQYEKKERGIKEPKTDRFPDKFGTKEADLCHGWCETLVGRLTWNMMGGTTRAMR